MTARSVHWVYGAKWKLAFVCGLILYLGAPAFGFCSEPHPTVICDFLNSDAVFSGKVLSVQTVNDGDAFEYRVGVLQVFRGPHDQTINIYTGNYSGRYTLDSNGEYLIFAYKYKGQLWINNCDDSVPLSQAKELMRTIQRITIPQDGIVEGRVILKYVPSDQGLAGVKILIRGASRTYAVTTDQQGWFHAHVPGGPYSIEAESSPAHPIVAYDLNYGGNSKKFVVTAGRCSGFEFVANSVHQY